MTSEEYWEIIDQVHVASGGGVDIAAKEGLLERELRKLSSEQLQSFRDHFDECLDRAYSHELWAAAFIILLFNYAPILLRPRVDGRQG